MKTKTILLTTILTSLSAQLPAAVIWAEDFEGASLGATSGNNQTLAGTTIQTANTASSIVVDATTDPVAAAAFTSASGNFIRLSVGDNDFSAVRSASNPISFTAVSDDDVVTMTADIYLPSDATIPVFSFNPRLESVGAAGNGATFSSEAVGVAGQYTITYTDTVANFKNPNSVGDVTTVRPFLFIEQKDGAADGTATDFLYMDNISLDISPIPEPSSMALLGLGAIGLLRRRR